MRQNGGEEVERPGSKRQWTPPEGRAAMARRGTRTAFEGSQGGWARHAHLSRSPTADGSPHINPMVTQAAQLMRRPPHYMTLLHFFLEPAGDGSPPRGGDGHGGGGGWTRGGGVHFF